MRVAVRASAGPGVSESPKSISVMLMNASRRATDFVVCNSIISHGPVLRSGVPIIHSKNIRVDYVLAQGFERGGFKTDSYPESSPNPPRTAWWCFWLVHVSRLDRPHEPTRGKAEARSTAPALGLFDGCVEKEKE